MVGRDFYREALEIEEEELLDKILAITHERHLKKKEVLIQAGETQNQIVFLVSGILRGFFLDAEGREVTDCFGLEPVTAAMVLVTNMPNRSRDAGMLPVPRMTASQMPSPLMHRYWRTRKEPMLCPSKNKGRPGKRFSSSQRILCSSSIRWFHPSCSPK